MGANGTDDTNLQKTRKKLDLSVEGDVQQQRQEQVQSDQAQLNASVQAYTERMAQEHADAEVVTLSKNATLTIMQDQGESQPPEAVQAPAQNMSMLRKITSGLPMHIPTSAAEPLAEYQFYDQKVSSMWKAHGVGKNTPDKVAARMKRHVDRFMCSDEITETDVSKMSTTVLESSEILKQKVRQGSDAEKKIDVLKKLENDTDGANVADILKDSRDLLKDPTGKELPWEDNYYKQHPACARILIMMNILQNINHQEFNVSGFKAQSRLEDRINGLIGNLSPLCELIRNSEEYAKALEQFSGVKASERETGFTGELKEKYEKGVKDRVKRLDHAMSRWAQYIRQTDSESTADILEKYMKTLEMYEEDMKLYQQMQGTDSDQLVRIKRYLSELERLKTYFKEGTTPEQKIDIEKSLGLVSERRRKKNGFYGEGGRLREKLNEFGIRRERPEQSKEKDSDAPNDYPPEVVENVRMIDQWLSAHVMDSSQSNTESNFASELLQKPFSQRLFAYYLLENKKRKEPSMSCVMLALNGYVPNLKKIRKVLMASKGKFWIRPMEFMKGRDTVRHTKLFRRALGQTGHVYLQKIEDTLRILDDKEKDYVRKIDQAREERKQAKAETDTLFQKRHTQSMECVRVFEEYRQSISKNKTWHNVVTYKKMKALEQKSQAAFRELSQINNSIKQRYAAPLNAKQLEAEEKKQRLQDAARDARKAVEDAQTALDQLNSKQHTDAEKAEAERALEEAKELSKQADLDAQEAMPSPEEILRQFLQGTSHGAGVSEAEMKEQTEREHMSIHDKIDKSIEIEETIVEKGSQINDVVVDKSYVTSGWGLWYLPSDDMVNSILAKAAFGTATGVLQLAEAISIFCNIPKELSEAGWSGVLEQVSEGMEKLSEAASTVTTAAETFANVAKIAWDARWNLEDGVGDIIGDIPGVKIAGTVQNGVEIYNSTRQVITSSVSESKQREAASTAKDLYQQKIDAAKNAGDKEAEKKLTEEQRRIANIRKMQGKVNKRRIEQASVKLVTSSLGIVGTFVPGADAVIEPLTTVISIGASIKEFYDKINEADSAIDDYIHMDELLKEYKAQFKKEDGSIDEAELQAMADEVLSVRKVARRDEVFKDEIRQAVLRELGFSSYADMADHIAEDYCSTVYDLIFKRADGKPIYEGDPDANMDDEMKQALVKLFHPLTFKYPKKVGDKVKPGKPTIDKMKESLLK